MALKSYRAICDHSSLWLANQRAILHEGVLEQLGLNIIIFHGFSQNESFLIQFQNSIYLFYVCIKEEDFFLIKCIQIIFSKWSIFQFLIQPDTKFSACIYFGYWRSSHEGVAIWKLNLHWKNSMCKQQNTWKTQITPTAFIQ